MGTHPLSHSAKVAPPLHIHLALQKNSSPIIYLILADSHNVTIVSHLLPPSPCLLGSEEAKERSELFSLVLRHRLPQRIRSNLFLSSYLTCSSEQAFYEGLGRKKPRKFPWSEITCIQKCFLSLRRVSIHLKETKAKGCPWQCPSCIECVTFVVVSSKLALQSTQFLQTCSLLPSILEAIDLLVNSFISQATNLSVSDSNE